VANLFPTGQIVSVIINSGNVFVGTFLGFRHHDDDDVQEIQYFFIQLTTAVGPYVIGEIIALNSALVESIGPVTA
jgi:hypothetical protein